MRARLSGTKRKDGRWQIVVAIPTPTGGRKRKPLISRKGESLRELQDRAHALTRAKSGPVPSRDETDVRALLILWRFARRRSWTAKTRRAREIAFRLWINPTIGRIKLADLKTKHVERMMDELLLAGTRVPTMARDDLRAALNFAIAEDWIDRNVAEFAKPPKIQRPPEKPYIDLAALQKIEAATASPTWAVFWRFLAEVGLRPDREALDVRWDHFYEDDDGVWLRVPGAKTPAGRMDRPISAALWRKIATLRHGAGSVFVFPDSNGGRADYANVARLWRKVLQAAGVPHTNPYQLRHLCGTTFLEANPGQDHLVAGLMGHANISTTRQYYARVRRAALRKIVERQ